MTAKPNLTLVTSPRPLPADHVERNPGMALDLDVVRSIRVNRSAVERRAATMGTRRTVKKEWQAAWLLRAITLMDLTTLSGDDTPGNMRRLCAKARHPLRDEIVRIDPSVRVLCTGGFQHASAIAGAIREGACDGVSIGRPLIANNDLPQILRHADGPAPGKECTYCNKCLLNDLENPLGCYELSRYEGASFDEKWEAMIKDVMSVYQPPLFR